MKAQFIYNGATDSLAVFTGKRTLASVELGREMIVDLDCKNNVTGVEFLNPDKLFRIPKRKLMGITRASLTSVARGGLLWAYVNLEMAGIEKEIPIPLVAPA